MLTAFDVGVGVLVLISAILATARGLTREVLSLATWAGSAAFAVYMYLYHSDIAKQYIDGEWVANTATVVISFILALIVLHLLTMRIADFVVDSRIGALDRTLGFVFGVLRGILIAVVIAIFGLWIVESNVPDWAGNSQSLPYLRDMGDALIAMLPEELEQQVTGLLQGSTDLTADPAGPALDSPALESPAMAPPEDTMAGEPMQPSIETAPINPTLTAPN